MKQLLMPWCGSDTVRYFVPVTAGRGAQMSRPLLSHGGHGTSGVVTERSTKNARRGVSGRRARPWLR